MSGSHKHFVLITVFYYQKPCCQGGILWIYPKSAGFSRFKVNKKLFTIGWRFARTRSL